MTQAADSHIPSRHGADIDGGRRIGSGLRRLIADDPEPTPERWQALGMALMRGDPPMDRVVEWMLDHGMREGRARFQQALDQGIDSLPHAPAPLRELFEDVDKPPRWLNTTLLEHGIRTCQFTSLTGLRILRDAALMAGYQHAAINKTLVLTGSLSRGPQRRLAETTKWWLDCTAPGGMDRHNDGFKNTLHVRLIHGLIRRRVQRMSEWDTRIWGVPVNQTDMAATQLGFSVVYLIGCRAMGIPLGSDEGRAVMHLWRYIGWLMGVDVHWLPETEQQGRTLLYQILLSQAPPDESSRQLGLALKDEPLQRYYPNLAWLRGHFNRVRHLSITSLFLDRRGRQALGLPPHTLPWYPALAAPFNFALRGGCRLMPGCGPRLCHAGRKAQVGYLRQLFGEATPEIHSPDRS